MCGLFGFAGKLQVEQRALLLRTLCLLNEKRGTHSVGLAAINRNWAQPFVYRAAISPDVAMDAKRFQRVCKADAQVWIGHTRYATRGKVTRDNAHPFRIGNVIGAHNGVIDVDAELVDRCDGAQYAVDSQYLFHLINRDGAVGPVAGVAALSYVELKGAADVTLIRHHNPLHVAAIGDDGVAWSSQSDHLRQALLIAGLSHPEEYEFEDESRFDVYLAGDGRVASVTTSESGVVHKPRALIATPKRAWSPAESYLADDDEIAEWLSSDSIDRYDARDDTSLGIPLSDTWRECLLDMDDDERADWLQYYGISEDDLRTL